MQQPLLLHETVSMLAMYINDASYVDSLNCEGDRICYEEGSARVTL